ncbi:PH domain-containing protein [Arthrobacter sp. I2-34]|uniref:PH domain-containing protein n=1 Tax=Arthrobacter hankyongi TaxID=2904801 RepID=A0ABS9LCV1_9MICC|nr:PH domain-containing protein [Arthrobacter hankyongi]MCG2624511.1 PH domain-containing protein [Arthrobacter hankyongi]
MASSETDARTVFRPRSAPWITGGVWLVASAGLAVSAGGGAAGLLQAVPLAALAYLAWWLAWYPAVVVDETGVTLRNPLSTIKVPWQALATVDTRYALTLVTPRRKYTAWAAPAPGIFGVHRARVEHASGLPDTTYGPAGSIRPGDLTSSDSGAAAYHVRKRWSELLAAGTVEAGDAGTAAVQVRPNWTLITVGAVLLAAAAASLAN